MCRSENKTLARAERDCATVNCVCAIWPRPVAVRGPKAEMGAMCGAAVASGSVVWGPVEISLVSQVRESPLLPPTHTHTAQLGPGTDCNTPWWPLSGSSSGSMHCEPPPKAEGDSPRGQETAQIDLWHLCWHQRRAAPSPPGAATVDPHGRESHPTSPDENQGEALDPPLLRTDLLLLRDQGHAWHSAPDKPVCQGVVAWPTAGSRLGRSMADPV